MFNIPDTSLPPRHKIVLRYDILGRTPAQIASLTGYKRETVYQIKSSDEYKRVKETLGRELEKEFLEKAAESMAKDPVRAQLEEAKTRAMELNIKMMERAESDRVRQRAIFDILDRAGYKPTERIEQDTNLSIDGKVAEGISEALEDLKKNG